jgi:hypothetical protein
MNIYYGHFNLIFFIGIININSAFVNYYNNSLQFKISKYIYLIFKFYILK